MTINAKVIIIYWVLMAPDFATIDKILSILYIFFSGVSSSGSLNAFERLTLRPSKVCIAFYKA